MAFDYLPPLPLQRMESAIRLSFEPYTPTSLREEWDSLAFYWTSTQYALLESTFVIDLTEGATYSIFSTSFFDPFILFAIQR